MRYEPIKMETETTNQLASRWLSGLVSVYGKRMNMVDEFLSDGYDTHSKLH
jgi:hypothetical protein